MENFVKLYTWKDEPGLWLQVKHGDNYHWYCVVMRNGLPPPTGLSLISNDKEYIAVKEKEYTFIADLADVWKKTWKL